MRAKPYSCQRLLALVFSALFIVTTVMAPASAAMVSTPQLLGGGETAPLGSGVRDALQQKLVDRGVPASEAQRRVAGLSDQEVIQVSSAIDEDPAGAGVLTVAAVIFLVLLWTDIMGYTDVFPFVNRSPNGSQGPVVTEN